MSENQIQSVRNQPTSEVLSQADLAKRLKVNPSTVYKRRDYSTKFIEWTSSLDPLGWAWEPVAGASSPFIYKRVRKCG